MDWYSRQVLSWELSNTMSVDFCLRSLNGALKQYGIPEIFNTDQGAQFTSNEYTGLLAKNNIAISMNCLKKQGFPVLFLASGQVCSR